MTQAVLRTTNWCLGAVVWLSAAFVFPLHLGLAGAPAAGLMVYAALAAGLLLTADILHDPVTYRGAGAVRAQAVPFLLAVAVPAVLAFTIGRSLAPLERTADEGQVCELAGLAATVEGPMQELDDGFDFNADCVPGSES